MDCDKSPIRWCDGLSRGYIDKPQIDDCDEFFLNKLKHIGMYFKTECLGILMLWSY